MKFSRSLLFLFLSLLFTSKFNATQLLIPMDKTQTNHLKAYGVAYWLLEKNISLEWLLNYRGGSFLIPHATIIEDELNIRGIRYEVLTDARANSIRTEISNPDVNQEIVQLEKAPKIAVYTPRGKQPWDDAVTLVLEYAEIKYDKIYDSAIVMGLLPKYDWMHLHHEDFTGQYGKFYATYAQVSWYKKQVDDAKADCKKLGFKKVSQMKLAVAKSLKNFVLGGGFLFTMCSGTDSFDIGLAAQNTDICANIYDGDDKDPDCQKKLDFNETFAFENFELESDDYKYEYSNIDGTELHKANESTDRFTLFDFSAKWDVIPTMLTQCHTDLVPDFYGQTTDFKKEFIKSNVLILGENKALGTAKYIHGELGQGTWTFYGGHDPEDYQHMVQDPPTDLNLHPNSPGYRLILNNILFPAAKKKKRKT